MVDVLLVSMPFAAAFAPSMALSLLQPQVRRRDLTCDIFYFTLQLAEMLGQPLYSSLETGRRTAVHAFAGEWIFSDALSDRAPGAERAYVRDVLVGDAGGHASPWTRPTTRARIEAILRAKRCVPGFLDACTDRVIDAGPRILGFTSVFQQHIASLALARRVKARRPETLIVFGGANVEGVMGAETLRQYPFVDAVVSGEGDLVFPELARRIVDGAPWQDLPGVLSRHGIRQAFAFGRFPNTPVVTDLDAVPYPEYADYFAQFDRTRFARRWLPNIYVETSRGCWWGERMHCTFCGLNGSTMSFRSKSADRAYAEFKHLADTHPKSHIQVVDNILDLKYFKTLLPTLAEKKLSIDLFYETKSNLKKHQVKGLRDAGVNSIQPGIESFSDQVLKVMKKGVSGLQNVQLLKWCKQFGVRPLWNFLFGFPGELPEEYQRMAGLMPKLMHLPGPIGFGPIRVDRFSPNFFDAARFGFANLRPFAAYQHIHDLPAQAVHNLAYHFDYDYQLPRDVAGYVRDVVPRLRSWRAGWRRYELLAIDEGGVLAIVDTRQRSRAPLTVLDRADRDVYLACDAIADLDTVVRAAAANGSAMDRDDVLRRLAAMVERGLMLAEGHQFLALAVPLGDYVPSGVAASRVLGVLARLGGRRAGSLCVPLDRAEYRLGGPAGRRIRPPAAPATLAAQRRAVRARLTRADVRIVRQRELRVRRVLTA